VKTKAGQSSANPWVLASNHGAGQYFAFFKIRRHLILAIFLFPFNITQLVANCAKIGQGVRAM
jgi:hypothetical protein